MDLASIDRPFDDASMFFEDTQQVRTPLVRYIERDLTLRTHPDHSGTQAHFPGAIARLHGDQLVRWSTWTTRRSQRLVPGWWHGFFSLADSVRRPTVYRTVGPASSRFHHVLGPDLEVTAAHQDAPEGTTGIRARARPAICRCVREQLDRSTATGATVVSSARPDAAPYSSGT